MLRRLVFAGALAVVVAGCQDKQLAQLAVVRDEVCSCKTPLCAEAAMGRLPKDDIRSDHRTQAMAREMMDCLAKIEEAETAKAEEDPDAAGSASGSGAGSAGNE